MKLLLLWAIVAISWPLIEGARRRTRNSACLVRNKYAHESSCRSRRRVYFTFHRVLFDCIKVTTNCRKLYRRNEFHTLEACRDACHYHMAMPVPPKPGNGTSSAPGAEGGVTEAAPAADAPPPAI
ncbi:uncharacterized protein LOC6543441 [Drosophila erecta]|uniref:BPTI/Kunitz inhibitor domain-containing protein n=1 Tax=Drosophila erecta TaxID=7220 RepID=B3N730_DROER|nr:uncharacterized protein LOC6543441 [Drosophila erecta]EDV59326.1 uncharacterized protein Dere_GG23462 [Drosophila erecta]